MANLDKPNGLTPVRYLNGAPYTGKFRKYIVPAADGTALFCGDLVQLSTHGSDEGYPTCVAGATNTIAVGVVVGFEVDPTNLNTPQYRAASTKRVVYVCDDPNVIYEVQEDGDTDPLETTDIGLNVSVVGPGSGNTATGASAVEINSDTHSTVSTLPLKLLGLSQKVGNENSLSAGGTAYTRWEVMLNGHQLTGLGVLGV